jgi:hypothetical protein
MSEPEERDRPDSSRAVEDTHNESAAESSAGVRTGGHNLETSELPDTGIGLSVGNEPNTFEPEEGEPA